MNAETNEDWNKKGDALLELSNIDLEQNRYEAGIIKLQKALVIFKKARFRAGVAICLNNLSNMMVYQNKNDEAMVLLQASLEIKRELGDKHLIASSLLNLAALHVDAKEYEKARLLFTEALTLREEIKDIRGISSAISELANLSLRENKPLEAMDLAERALAYSQKINDIRGITYAYMILGYCYLEQKQIEKATQYLIQALEIAKEHRIILFIVDILYGFILILQDQQQIRLALTINNYLDYHFKSELSFNPIYDPQLTNRLERIATAEEKDEVRNSVAILDLLSLVDLVIYS